jgi:hypothetical protein
MARIEVHPDRVTISLSRSEKLLAFHRRDIVIDRSQVRSALITDDPWIWMRGIPSPGTHLAGRVACGVWRGLGGEDFLLVRGKHKAVVIDIDVPAVAEVPSDQGAAEDDVFSHFGRVILSTAHAAELIRALKLDQPSGSNVHTTRSKKKRSNATT